MRRRVKKRRTDVTGRVPPSRPVSEAFFRSVSLRREERFFLIFPEWTARGRSAAMIVPSVPSVALNTLCALNAARAPGTGTRSVRRERGGNAGGPRARPASLRREDQAGVTGAWGPAGCYRKGSPTAADGNTDGGVASGVCAGAWARFCGTRRIFRKFPEISRLFLGYAAILTQSVCYWISVWPGGPLKRDFEHSARRYA